MRLLTALSFMLLLLIGCSAENNSETASEQASQVETTSETTASTETAAPANQKTPLPPRTQTTNENGKVIKDESISIEPHRIEIPSIGVDALVEQVGVIENGQMGVPESFETVGWYNEGPMPGERGNSVISGHVDSRNGPAVFFDLKNLEAGDEIIVSSADGESLTYVVDRIETYPENESPVEAIFDYSFQSNLNLITCTGTFNRESRNYSDRLVVYSSLKK
ncbi:class F sortase [Sutcliffiella horikoshii]|uniref:class F sortase n=1 Tax=Sutcliffiella horikoshii TaxID=79883 RepID=UPI001CFE205F|nr:class F sortase [Sutcliffiella horikoshii]